MNPELDGITHINVYSKGKTAIGRFLSNFTYAPFVHPLDGPFDSVEGYWYWLSVTHPRRDELRTKHGVEAKNFGRLLRGKDWIDTPDFHARIKAALRAKLTTYPQWLTYFRALPKLPLTHYYVYQNRVRDVPDAQWILDELDLIRKEQP